MNDIKGRLIHMSFEFVIEFKATRGSAEIDANIIPKPKL
jgi:hypothetical protein